MQPLAHAAAVALDLLLHVSPPGQAAPRSAASLGRIHAVEPAVAQVVERADPVVQAAVAAEDIPIRLRTSVVSVTTPGPSPAPSRRWAAG